MQSQQVSFVRKRIFSQLLVFAFGAASLASSAFGQQKRYLAVLGDGRRVSGDKLTGWHTPGGTVRLDNTVIAAPGRPLRWMRDRMLKRWQPANRKGGLIEFVGGDRIVGRVLGGQAAGYKDGLYVPAHVVVQPTSPKYMQDHQGGSLDSVRVLPDRIRRVVLMPDLLDQFQPGMVFYRDGHRVGFDSIRWRAASVLLLMKDGTRTVPLSDIAEVHMPRTDPWEAYYRELAVLSPSCRSHLIRIETTDGTIATGSESRFSAEPFGYETILAQANGHRISMRQHIERAVDHDLKYRQKFEKTRADQKKQMAVHDAGIKKEQEAQRKALAETKARLEKQRLDDAAKSAAKRKKLEETYRKELADIEKGLAKTPPAQRDAKRKQSSDAKKQVFDAAVKSLAGADQQAEAKRQASLKKFEAELAAKLARLVQAKTALESAMAQSKAAAARQHAAYMGQIASYKASRDALPGPDGFPETWYHMVQPAWSLDPLWVPFKSINMRWSFPPDKFPLSRAGPTETVSPAMLRWRADRNSDGAMLRSGGLLHGWGFGVHAYSELAFTLPPAAISFHTRLGLDRLAHTGGCVRGKVYLGSTKTKPVYESPLLIGSQKTVETGDIRIPSAPKVPISLILQADPINRNHPPQADPLNIRDKLDWLEPQLGLDPVRLRSEVSWYIAPSVAAWRGWTATFDKRGVYTCRSWLARPDNHERERFLPVLRVDAQPLKLSKEMKIPVGDKWLVVDVGFPDGRDIHAKALTLRIGDKEIQAEKLPIRQYWRRRTAPLVYSIEKYRGKKTRLELTQQPDGKELYWRGIATSNRLPADYRLARYLEAIGQKDMEVPRGLGLALQSWGIGKRDALMALEVAERGGTVAFCNDLGDRGFEYLHCVMVGCDWTGGEKTFHDLKKLHWFGLLIIAADSGITPKMVGDLYDAKAHQMVIWRPGRTPSITGGISCVITVRNRRDKNVLVARIERGGGFHYTQEIKPGREVKIHSHEGFRYEAHIVTGDYNKSKPISRLLVKRDAVWEIK